MKKKRIKLKTLNDLEKNLIQYGYVLGSPLKESLNNIFNINEKISQNITEALLSETITYTSLDMPSFIHYFINLESFMEEHINLYNSIKNIRILRVQRIEYHRDPSPQENVDDILSSINTLSCITYSSLNSYEIYKFDELESHLKATYLYSKDVELLKNILFECNNGIDEYYNSSSMVKEITFNIPKHISANYIKAPIGTIEHYNHISSYIPRLKRLSRNLHKYLTIQDDTHILNQSDTLLDSMNIAYCIYDNHEFKALSGDVEVSEYCSKPKVPRFISSNVNRLGRIGTGYTRENDSEKKILEEIYIKIKNNSLKDNGELVLYTKWEPCQSCYYVISQFSKEFPNINITIKYSKKYGL